MRRVLVTGASGFIGRQALAPLTVRGYEVHAVARHVPGEDAAERELQGVRGVLEQRVCHYRAGGPAGQQGATERGGDATTLTSGRALGVLAGPCLSGTDRRDSACRAPRCAEANGYRSVTGALLATVRLGQMSHPLFLLLRRIVESIVAR